MVQVIKKRDLDNTNVIFIRAEEGDFVFTFCGNYDLYFSYFGKDLRKKEEHTFILDKDNFFLYNCFDEAYRVIESEKPLQNGYTYKYLDFPLLKNGIIEWHSDDGYYDSSAILYIEKLDNAYKIVIKEGIISDIQIRTASVRFRNSGSIYDPYNCVFMNLYNKICEHNFEYEQITLDEYIDKAKIRMR